MGLKQGLFNVYVALNMLLCSVIFFRSAQPRETISGYLGRKHCGGTAARWVDRLYFWEPDHCCVVSKQEAEARKALYS